MEKKVVCPSCGETVNTSEINSAGECLGCQSATVATRDICQEKQVTPQAVYRKAKHYGIKKRVRKIDGHKVRSFTPEEAQKMMTTDLRFKGASL